MFVFITECFPPRVSDNTQIQQAKSNRMANVVQDDCNLAHTHDVSPAQACSLLVSAPTAWTEIILLFVNTQELE